MSFVTDDGAKFIVFIRPREVKIYTLFGKIWVKLSLLFFLCGKKYSVRS